MGPWGWNYFQIRNKLEQMFWERFWGLVDLYTYFKEPDSLPGKVLNYSQLPTSLIRIHLYREVSHLYIRHH